MRGTVALVVLIMYGCFGSHGTGVEQGGFEPQRDDDGTEATSALGVTPPDRFNTFQGWLSEERYDGEWVYTGAGICGEDLSEQDWSGCEDLFWPAADATIESCWSDDTLVLTAREGGVLKGAIEMQRDEFFSGEHIVLEFTIPDLETTRRKQRFEYYLDPSPRCP